STQLSLADVSLKGSFLVNKECLAFQSFRKRHQSRWSKSRVWSLLPTVGKERPIATHYRVRIENASPPERWVSADCGFLQEEKPGSQGSESPSDISTENETQFVLSLSWEPGFCESHNSKAECANEGTSDFNTTHFTLHGLWPQPRRREYCNVAEELIEADKRGNWQALPNIDLTTETRDRLAVAMPGIRSLLERHEWIRHGTCYGGDAETYFRQALSLV